MLAVAVTLAAALAAAAPKPAAPEPAATAPWERPGFSAPAAEIARAAAALPDPASRKGGIDVLFEEGIFSFDEAGRVTYTYRLVYRPLTRAAAESWAETARAWSPWHEERPSVRARVVLPDGTEHLLDPRTLSEAADDDGNDGLMYFDRRVLRGPIPHVAERSVVEEESTVRETAPTFDGGTVHRWWVGRPVVTRKIRLVVSAPEKLPLRFALRGGLAGKPLERREQGRRVLEWSWTDVPARRSPEPNLPPERAANPHLAFGTGRSWQAIAAGYAELVDRQLAGAELEARARELAGGARDRREVAQRLLAWIGGKVRYTGLELGQAAIVPVPPAEALKRGYGDCKDLSLLLTGLLRALGHPAELALVRTGVDDPADLPGLGEFDHAIVHVPGSPELWIDPTDPDTAAGELPPGDQGRLALLANRGATKLVRTPDAGAAANRIELDRELVLAEAGRAHATETRLLRGSRAAAERQAHRRMRAADLAKEDEETAKQVFVDAKLVSARRDGLEGAGPVTVRLEADQSRWAVTADAEAEAVAGPGLAFARLPEPLQPKGSSEKDKDKGDAADAGGADGADGAGDDDEADGDEEERAASPAKRTADFLAGEAHETVVRYRVVPPPGFTAGPLPEPVRISVGPARYERSFAVEKDGSVTGVHRFVLASRRIAAKDAEALRAALAPFAEDGPRVKFERISERLLGENKGREAIAEIRRLAALHPTEARHHAHLALALLRLGMGEAARKEARRAAELEPSNGWAHRVVATALEHDLIGRYLEPGCDLAGAAAAQRRAVELEKDAPATRAHLAFILEHGAGCVQWAKGAKLDEAAQVLRAIRTQLKNKEHDDELLEVYLRAERFADARALAREMKEGPAPRVALLAAAAALDGAPAAVREASRIPTADRPAALQGAVAPLLRARRYAEAAALLEAAGQGSASSAELRSRAALIGRIQRSDRIRFDAADPATLFPRAVRDLIAGAGAAKLSSYLLGGGASDREALDAFRTGFEAALRTDRSGSVTPETAGDIALSLVEWSKDGDAEAGYRFRYSFPFAPKPLVLHALPTDRGFRLVADEPEHAVLAASARRLVEAGKLPAARRLLRFARDAAPQGAEQTAGAVLAALWTHGDEAGADELRAAATALAAMKGDAELARRLEDLRAQDRDPARRRALGWALAQSHSAGERWEALLRILPELADGDAGGRAFGLRAIALVRLGRRAELAQLAEARLRRSPDEVEPLRWLRRAAMAAADVEGVLREGRRLLATGRAEPEDWNEVAWVTLFRDPPAPDALEQARKGVMLTQEKSAAVLHTLAMVHAARGEGAEALQVLVKSIAARSGREPESSDWLVVGRIAEGYGLLDEAIAAYRRVTPRKGDTLGSDVLAARRLEKLGAKVTPATATAPRAQRGT